jgi:pimeloyl-ACP methyl ester carboxylesterase
MNQGENLRGSTATFWRAVICFFLVAAAYGQSGTDAKQPDSSGRVNKCARTKDKAICPFQISISQAALDDLRRRFLDTKWPEREAVTDASQGVQLATMKALVNYWANNYDWRNCEAKLNAHPQSTTDIDGLDIHFIHVRSKNSNALPLTITHGWPGSIIEPLKVIDPLTDPAAHGAEAVDAFDVVIPSLPGYGFSGKPSTIGWDPIHIASAWTELMRRLGYKQLVAQGGDWGKAVTEQMALQAPPELIGVHTNMPDTESADIAKTLQFNEPPPSGLPAEEKGAWDKLVSFYKHSLGYAQEMANRPQTLYALADSPFGLAAWMVDHDARSQALIKRVQKRGERIDARRHSQ